MASSVMVRVAKQTERQCRCIKNSESRAPVPSKQMHKARKSIRRSQASSKFLSSSSVKIRSRLRSDAGDISDSPALSG